MTQATPGSAAAASEQGFEFVRYEKKGHVAYVTINRPERNNALHAHAFAELRRCWLDMARDKDIYVGIVTGEGHAFCGGMDVKFLAEHHATNTLTPMDDPNHELYQVRRLRMPAEVGLDKPLIAAINGLAVGAGLSLALQCQLRVMADDAWLGDQHTNVGRLGPAHQFYAKLPHATAAYLTLCNGRLTAAECLQQGIVNKVVPGSEVLRAAEEMAEMVTRAAPRAVQAAVRLYRLADQNPVLTDYASHLNTDISEGEDVREGPRAFKERRAPVWTGR